MIKLTNERIQEALDYMDGDLVNCLYLYGDIVCYGLDDPNMTVWYSEKDGEFTAIVMKYFSGSHVYSRKGDYDLDEIVSHLYEISPDRISAPREIAEKLIERMNDVYEVEYGGVFRLYSYREMKSPVPIEKATGDDARQIAELLMTHETYSSTYDVDALAAELKDRIEKGVGRSYIMRDGDRIVAHDGVNIETDKFAVEGLALVHEDFRRTLYGSFLDSYMINDLGKEGKELYCMIAEGRRLDAFVKIGNEVQARYGKLFKKNL